jgi:hypothetical protein
MSIDLSSYTSIQTSLFVRVDVPGYDVLRFSNYNKPVTINGESYVGMGSLLAISDSSSDLRAASGSLTITLSGIPNSSISEILSYKFKGSKIQVWRVFFDTVTGQQLEIEGNPAGRFQGVISNFGLDEDWQMGATVTSNRISFVCASTVDVLSNKVTGRRTNPTDQKKYYATDVSMDRVLALADSNFNFGAPIF